MRIELPWKTMPYKGFAKRFGRHVLHQLFFTLTISTSIRIEWLCQTEQNKTYIFVNRTTMAAIVVITCVYRQGRIHVWSESAPPPFRQINHANSAYFRLFWGYFRVISATRPPFRISAPLFTYPGSAPV